MSKSKKRTINTAIAVPTSTTPATTPEVPNEEAPKKVVTPKPVLKKVTEPFTLKITNRLLEKIEYLCITFPTLEWSGTLFYTIEGDLNSESLVVTAVDLFLQDIGSGTYTEYAFDEEYAGFMAANAQLRAENIFEGHIHSHNTMAAFFSGTDETELIDSSITRKNFLSLIVNNAGNYVAAIGTLGEANIQQTTTYKYTLFSGEEDIFSTPASKTIPIVFMRSGEIQKEAPERTLKGLFSSAIDRIREKKVAINVAKYASPSYNYPAGYAYGNRNYSNPSGSISIPNRDDDDDLPAPNQNTLFRHDEPVSKPTPLILPFKGTSQEALKAGQTKVKEGTLPFEAEALQIVTKGIACAVYFKGTISEAIAEIPLGLSLPEYEQNSSNVFDSIVDYVVSKSTSIDDSKDTYDNDLKQIMQTALAICERNNVTHNIYASYIQEYIETYLKDEQEAPTSSEAINNIKNDE